MTAPRVPLRTPPTDDLEAQVAAIRANMTRQPASSGDPSTGDPLEAHVRTVRESLSPKDNAAGFLNAVGQGATLGFSDEILGGLAGLNAKLHGQPFGPAYDDAVAKVRGLSADYRADQPGGSIATELAAGAALPLGAAKAATTAAHVTEDAGLLARGLRGIGSGLKTGAAYGAVAGAGSSEGGIGNRALGAGLGAGFGAVTGGAIGGVAPLLGALASKGSNELAIRTGQIEAPVLHRPSGPSVTGEISPVTVADRKAALNAVDKLRQQLGRDNLAPADIRAKAAALRAQGLDPGTIMDLAGENVRGTARGAHAIPSSARQQLATTLAARGEGDFGRVQQQLEKGLGGPREDVQTAAADIVARRKELGSPLYQTAFAQPPVEDTDGALMELLNRPSGQKALRYAQQVAAEQGKTLPPIPKGPAADPITAMIPDAIKDDADAVAAFRKAVTAKAKTDPALAQQIAPKPAAIPVETLHHVKLALDDMTHIADRANRMGTARVEEGGLGPTGISAMKDTRGQLLDLIDQKVPDYKAARDVWAGESALKTALEQGQEASAKKMDPRELARLVDGMSDSEKALVRKGYLDSEVSKMEDAKDGRDYVKQVFGSPAERARLRVLVGSDQEVAQLEAAMKHFTNRRLTQQIVSGSPTSRIEAEKNDLGDVATTGLSQFLRGGWRRTAAKALERAGQPELARNADALAPYLLAGEPGYPPLEDALTAIERSRFRPRDARPSPASHALVRALSEEEGLRFPSLFLRGGQ